MSKLEYNIFENAIDSIKHGIEHFLDAHMYKKQEGRNYKYALLLAIQGVELFLKERLLRINPVLIYANIDRPITEDSTTVNFKALPQRLMNAGISLTKEWLAAIEEGRKIRNRIEHKDVSFSLKETRWLLGRTFRFLIQFAREELGTELKEHLTDSEYEQLIRQSGFFEEIYAHAESKAEEVATELEATGTEVEIWHCPECEAKTIVMGFETGTTSLYTDVCPMCKFKVYLAQCTQCGRITITTEEPGTYYFCSGYCEYQFHGVL